MRWAASTVTGHSLGGALTTCVAMTLVASGVNRVSNDPKKPLIPVTAITFEAPRAGNWAFAEAFHATDGPRHFRITNVPDIVPKLPYMANPTGGVLLQFLTTNVVTLRTKLHVFGFANWVPKAIQNILSRWIIPGVEYPRPPAGEAENGLAFLPRGDQLQGPCRLGAIRASLPARSDRSLAQSNLVVSNIDPDTRAPAGPRAVVG
eukprot:jgi/Botrbrau1/300/Bobra.0022s0266.1